MMRFRSLGLVCVVFCGFCSASAQNTILQVEGGSVFQSRNNVAVPADADKFSYRQLLGRGPFGYQRLTAMFNADGNSGYRFVWAPLSISGKGTLDHEVTLDGTTFASGTPTEGHYRFNNYRFTWWHRWKPWLGFNVRSGWTLFVRDAKVSLSQTGRYSSFSNIGPVPLFYWYGERALNDRWVADLEFDGLVAPQGGALDFGASVGYRISNGQTAKLQWRYLDGGTGRGSAYNFASITFIGLGIETRW